MNQMNQVLLEGNLVAAPEQKEIGEGRNVSHLSVAVNKFYKDKNGEKQQEVSYFDVDVFGSLSDKVSKAEKGQKIRVVGRLEQAQWKSAEGKNMSKLLVVAESIELERPGLVINNSSQIILEGNLTAAPEQKEIGEGRKVSKFTIASNKSYKKNEEWVEKTSFIDVDAFGKTGEIASGIAKGKTVRIVGELKQNRWTDANGKNRSKISIVAEHIEKKREITKKDPGMDMGR